MREIFWLTTLLAAGAVMAPAAEDKPKQPAPPEPVIVDLDLDVDVAPVLAGLEGLGPLTLLAELQDQLPTPPPPPAAPRGPEPFVWHMETGRGSYLGVGVDEIDAERAKEMKLPEERGVRVTQVTENGPAAKAGIKEGDAILEYNGQKVEGVEEFVRLVRETPAGREVKLLISRNGKPQTLTATIGDRRAMSREWEHQMRRDMEHLQQELGRQRFDITLPEIPQIYTTWRTSILGVEAEGLGSQLAEAFGVKKGVLVRSVTKDSPADKAGLKAGDVIVKVEGEEVSTPNEISSRLRRIEGSKTVPLTIVRNRAEKTVQVTVEVRGRGPMGREFGGPQRIHVTPRPAPPAAPAPPAPPARFVSSPRTAL